MAIRLGVGIAIIAFIAGCSVPEEHAPEPVLVNKAPPFTVQSTAQGSPAGNARQYQRALTGAAHEVWGLDAPLAMFAGQIHQESGWNEQAKSPVGAAGLAQFMPATAKEMGKYDPALGDPQPYNPTWALRALVTYDKAMYARITSASVCDNYAFTLSAYNGGLGWVYRDQQKAASMGLDSHRYWGQVEAVNAGRNAAAFTENRGYPDRIIKILQARYQAWGPMVCSV